MGFYQGWFILNPAIYQICRRSWSQASVLSWESSVGSLTLSCADERTEATDQTCGSGSLGNCFDGSVGKESACNAGDTGNSGLILGSGRSSAGGNGDPFQYSCLENPMDREAWLATVQRVTKSWTGLTTHTHTHAHTHTCKDRDRQAPRPGCGVLLGFWSFLCTCPGTKTFQEVSCLGERCSGE